MQFVVGQYCCEDSYHSRTQDVQEELFDNDSLYYWCAICSSEKANAGNLKATYGSLSVTKSPASVFITSLLEAGKIVQPVAKNVIPELRTILHCLQTIDR